MSEVSLVNGHIDEPKKQRQIDRIRNMSVEELANFLEITNTSCAIKLGDGYIVRDKKYIRIWLESEVDTE